MKPALPILIALGYSLSVVLPSYANFSNNPDLVEISAKHAKLRAKLRSQTDTSDVTRASDETENTVINQQLNDDTSNGCNLNVGNVLIDDSVHTPPDEVIIIIEGDIIQSNNCR